MKTIKFTMLSPEEKLALMINQEDVYFVFLNNEEIWNTLNRKEAEYYFEEFKFNTLI